METGTIKRLTDRGYGFIGIEGKDKDLFFHSKELADGVVFEDLREGDSVSFEVASGEKGDYATKVTKA